MEQEERLGCFDHELKIEAHQLKGIIQKFPNHFHEYYVFGFIQSGERYLSCKNKEYIVGAGDLIIFNPFDNHTCHPVNDQVLDWRCINIPQKVMHETVKQITGKVYLPNFTTTVIYHCEMVPLLRELHDQIIERRKDFEKEEIFYFLIMQLITEYTETTQELLGATTKEIEKACSYIQSHYTDLITLDDLSELTSLNKYTLLRNFTKQRGITPYQYLETIRINEAKKLLENRVSPLDVAMRTGFSDQSHFCKFFKRLVGLTPKQYGDIFKEYQKGLDEEEKLSEQTKG